MTPLRRTRTRAITDTHAGNFTATGLASREPPMIGFKRASVTATNSASRPPTAVLTYPNPVSWRMNTKRMADIISACRR
jgi:hypothetical protein